MLVSPHRSTWIRWLAPLGACCAAAGCAVTGNPGLADQVALLPQAVRNQTHVVFVESPVDVAGFGRLRETAGYLDKLGIANVSIGYYDSCELADRIRHVARDHPGARVMVVGWSAGSTYIVDAARQLECEGVRIDSAVILDSEWIKGRLAEGAPSNVGRYALVYREGHKPPLELPNSQVYEVPTLNHFAVPTKHESVDILLTEILRMSEPSADPAPLTPAPSPVGRGEGEGRPAAAASQESQPGSSTRAQI
jgi:hypothetical protein